MKALETKLLAALKAIDAVEKRGINQKQGYSYVKAADVAHQVRGVLAEHGISFGYDVTDSEHWSQQTQGGNSMNVVQLKIEATFTDTESGESVVRKGIGWGTDSLDKAPYKAMTGALKYILRMNFLIPDESDPENEHADGPREIKRKSVKSESLEPQLRQMVNGKVPASIEALKQIGVRNGQKFMEAAASHGKTQSQIIEFLGTLGCTEPFEIRVSQMDEVRAWIAGQ